MRLRETLDRLFGIDSRSLAAFRVGIGALVLADLWTRSSALEHHYSDAGILSGEAYARLLSVSAWQWSIHLWAGSVTVQAFLFTVAAVAATALVVGYRARAATIVSWAMLVSLQARNPMVLYGADQLLRLMLFWAMFLPLDEAWAVDRRRETGPATRRTRHLSAASAAMLLQPCVMYFFAGLLKSNPSWQSGEALGYVLSSDMYVTSFGRVLAGFPDFVTAMCRAVPWIEMLAPVPLLLPWRTAAFRGAALVLLVAFHTGMGCSLRTGLFQPVALVSLIPFLPAGFWDRIGPGYGALVDPRMAPVAATAPPRRRGALGQAVVALLFVYGMAWNVVGLSVERYSAENALAWMKEWWSEGRAGVPLSFRDYAVERQMGSLGWIGRVTALHQRWDMFVTAGPEMRGWPTITGTLVDGEKVTVLDGRVPPESPPGPEDAPEPFPGTRWLVYFTYLRTSGTRPARELLPPVVTRDWERRNPGRRLASLEISFVHPEESAPNAKPASSESWYHGPANGLERGR